MSAPDVSGCETRVTVDLDGKSYSVDGFRQQAIKAYHNLDRHAAHVDVHVSSGQQGIHLVAWFEDEHPFAEQIEMRRAAGDDPRRVDMDCQRWLNGLYTDVLFETKDGRPMEKERRFSDVFDALDYIDGQRLDDHTRMKRVANAGHKGDPELARRV